MIENHMVMIRVWVSVDHKPIKKGKGGIKKNEVHHCQVGETFTGGESRKKKRRRRGGEILRSLEWEVCRVTGGFRAGGGM